MGAKTMTIQILGLREYEVNGKIKSTIDFLKRNWRAPTVQEMFAHYESYIRQIPMMERYNLFYTVAVCHEGAGRKLKEQTIIPIDVDGIDTLRAEEYVPVICSALGIKEAETGIVMSGNGLQFLIGIKEPITDTSYFKEKRSMYGQLCTKIDEVLNVNNLPGHADPSVWSPARLMRMPETQNVKQGKGTKAAYFLNRDIVNIDSPLGIMPEPAPPKEIEEPKPVMEVKEEGNAEPKRYDLIPLDVEGIQNECLFVKHSKEKPKELTEQQWYSLVGVLGRVDRDLVHEYSKLDMERYDFDDTEGKIDHALDGASGPDTCFTINQKWSGCEDCKHYKKVTTPLQVRSDDFIKTKDIGFRKVNWAKNPPTQGKPDYDDLLKYFSVSNPYISLAEYKSVYRWNSKFWQEYPINRIKAFAENNIDFAPTNAERMEFMEKVLVNNMKDQEFLNPYGYANFQNGMLRLPGGKSTGDIETPMQAFKLYPHDSSLGLTYILPFEYDREATCPRFEKFIEEVTCEDPQLQYVLQEYMGYALSNSDPELGERALFLLGEGSNGKSVFLDVMKWLAGDDNYSSVPLDQLEKETSRFELYGKLFNVTEETPQGGLRDSSIFKNLVTGGTMIIRRLYKDPMTVKNKTKLIMAANELPRNQDVSKGMFRKILIVPFNAVFEGDKIDRSIRQKLKAELPGIFNWAMDGYERLRKNSFHFTASSAISNELDVYRDLSDPLRAWARENITSIDDDSFFTPIEEIYAKYVVDMESDKLKPMPKNSFGLRLKKIFKFRKTQRKMVDGRRLSVIHGLRLQEEGHEI